MKITLCGSAKFEKEYHEANKRLTLNGHIIYSLGAFPSIEGGKTWYDEEQKIDLDLVHLIKIKESDAIYVINVDDYIGDSTKREILWARLLGKRIYYHSHNELDSIEL